MSVLIFKLDVILYSYGVIWDFPSYPFRSITSSRDYTVVNLWTWISFGLLAVKDFKIIWLSNILPTSAIIKVIPETCHAHLIGNLCLYCPSHQRPPLWSDQILVVPFLYCPPHQRPPHWSDQIWVVPFLYCPSQQKPSLLSD